MARETLGLAPQRNRREGERTLHLSPWQPPPAQPTFATGQLDLWRFRLDLSEPDTQALKQLLRDDERMRAGRLLDPLKAAHFTVARGRLRQILARYLEQSAESIEFAYGEQGKPRLRDSSDHGLAFNLSHAGVWCVVAVSAEAEVGVDLELIDSGLECAKVAAHYFSSEERALWETYSPARRQRGFYRIWTRKEALLKGHGGGFASLSQLRLGSWVLRSFPLTRSYLAVVAVHAPIQAIQRWDLR